MGGGGGGGGGALGSMVSFCLSFGKGFKSRSIQKQNNSNFTFFFLVCVQSAMLSPSVSMLPGTRCCRADLPPLPAAVWWLSHPAARTRVCVATRRNSSGGSGRPSALLLCSHRVLNHDVVCLLLGCLTSQQHASVSRGWIGSDLFMCCHTEMEIADQAFHLTQSQYTDTGPTCPSTDSIAPGAWQGSHWSASF